MRVKQRISKKMCNSMSCPAVLLSEDNNIFAIGEDVSAQYNCANGETVIRVPKEVFESRAN